MKIFLKISILAFLFIGFSCSILLADNREFTAFWERGADGRNWGECVLNQQNSIDIKHQFRLNALCDFKAFEETSRMRREMLYAVKLDISSNRVSDVTEQYGYILESYASIGVVPLRAEERMLLSRLLWRKRHMVRDMRLAGGSRRRDESQAISEAAVSVNPPRRDAGRYYTNKKNSDYRINSFAGRVNLNIYSLRFDKVDYFSLILYLWEDNPFDRNRNTACISRLKAIPTSLISHNLLCHLSGKKPQDSFNQNSKGETQSGVFRSVLSDCSRSRYFLTDSFGDSERVFSDVLRSKRFRGTGGSL